MKTPNLYTTMRKRISNICGIVCVVAVFAGAVESLDGGITAWNIICLAIAGLSGWASKRLEEAR